MMASSSGIGGGGAKPHEMSYDVLNCFPEDVDSKDLFTTRCSTVEEKYRLLETRDKVLRARIPKVKVRVEFATRLFGTCPDMCPEKERYMRQYQRQLTSFEIDNSAAEVVVDHKKAIKAYSRSSADQDEPLPHDLRPGSTLEMTLNYLLHHIVPMGDVNEDILGDWYNFLWDRTRSLRKDITQQQLTDLCVVSIMEKCARFHIHCSSRLCELDVNLFVPKFNDENLVKCLQSLEHLYDDLRRRDVKCPNEPEFRAYQIMMNLNEGDILLSVQQWPDWILKSSQVQAAIKVHHFIFSKNFVGFFRLVYTLPYMFSCILHRYFYQVRFRALYSMCRSIGRKGDGQLVFSNVQRMLGYGVGKPSSELQHVCDLHGLVVDLENDRIIYNRRRFVRPESRIISRETYLIESKLITTTAEAINGGPLSENPMLTYKPHDSFNDEGFLKPGLVAGQSSAGTVVIVPKSEQKPPKLKDSPDAFATAAIQKTKMPGFMSKAHPDIQPTHRDRPKITSKFRLNEQVFNPKSKSPTPSPFDLTGRKSKISVDVKDGSGLKSSSSVTPTPTVFGSGPSVFGGSSSTKLPSTNVFSSENVVKAPVPLMSIPSTLISPPEPVEIPATVFKSPFEGKGAFTGAFGNQAVFGGNAGFSSVSAVPTSTPSIFSASTPSVFSSSTPSVFSSSTPSAFSSSAPNVFPTGVPSPFPATTSAPKVETLKKVEDEDFKAKKLQLIDSVCDKAFDEVLHSFIHKELQRSVKVVLEKNIIETKMQEKLRMKEALRMQMAERAMESVLDKLVPECVSNITQEEVQRERWLQFVCELYATKQIDSIVTSLVGPICLASVNQQRSENEKIVRKIGMILKRLKLRLIINKWRAYARGKQVARKMKEEKLLYDMLNFPATNPVGRSPKEILHQFRGNGKSPNIIKTGMTTITLLDKYERAQAVAQNFKHSIANFVNSYSKKSPQPALIFSPEKLHVNQDYYRHCYKRRWPSGDETTCSETDPELFNGRRNKSPRQEFVKSNNHTSPSSLNKSLTNGNKDDHLHQDPLKLEKDSLLEELRKFAEETKREKENFKKAEAAIDKEYHDDSIFLSMRANPKLNFSKF